MKWIVTLCAVAIATVPTAAVAEETFHVDADAATEGCVGDGSEAAPFGTIECAFAAGGFGPGDRIVLHDAAVPYTGASTAGLGLQSGTATAPVVIEPAPGAAPIVTSSLAIVDVSHWTLRGLTFAGTGCGDTEQTAAIRVLSESASMTGIVVADNAVIDWPGRAIELDGAGTELVGVEVRGNRLQAACGHAIWAWSVDATSIVDNDIADVQCVVSQFQLCTACGEGSCWQCGDCLDTTPAECAPEALVDYDYGALVGLRVLGNSSGVEVAYNRFHDFLDTACGSDGRRAAAIFATRTASNAGHIHHNLIERIAPAEPDAGYGILLMQGAEGWSVDHNVVVEAGQCGLCENDRLFYGGQRNVWTHNTVLGGEVGIDLAWAADSLVRGNLVDGARARAVRVQTVGEGLPQLDHNVYWPADATAIGEWNGGGAESLEGWQSACACDQDTRVGDPGLVVDPLAPVLTPAADGTAIDAVPPGRDPFHGEQADAGALEAPRVLGAAIAPEQPDTIVVAIEDRVAPPLRGHETCTGFTVVVDGESVAPVRCESTDAETLEIVVAEPMTSSVELAYAGGFVTDSVAVGRRVDAGLAPFVVAVEGAADDTGAPGSTSGTLDDSTGSEAAPATGDDGCSCNAPRSRAPWWIVVLAWGRRRRA